MVVVLGLAVAAAWIYLAVGRGFFWIPLLPEHSVARAPLPSIDIVVPARDEAGTLQQTLPSLLVQRYTGAWRIILVDDHSQDGTGAVARKIAADMKKEDRLTIISAPDLPEGWSGKVSAMNAGVNSGTSDYILFTDADVRHSLSSLEKLAARAQAKNLDLVSRMVKLTCESLAEKLLIPAFVFFFAMLYPFRRVNSPNSPVAAAAGGVMLARRTMLEKIGGLAAIKSELIDDCALAKAVKQAGGMIELTLSRDMDSMRAHPDIRDIWQMVARTAYTQLKLSPVLLAKTIAGMAFMFLLPIALFLFASSPFVIGAGLAAQILMIGIYVPMVRFYNLPPTWALTLPIAACVFAAATIDSARLYNQGMGGQWKGRVQEK
jgi:hopene-associated glycosyltransferase HpnB